MNAWPDLRMSLLRTPRGVPLGLQLHTLSARGGNRPRPTYFSYHLIKQPPNACYVVTYSTIPKWEPSKILLEAQFFLWQNLDIFATHHKATPDKWYCNVCTDTFNSFVHAMDHHHDWLLPQHANIWGAPVDNPCTSQWCRGWSCLGQQDVQTWPLVA